MPLNESDELSRDELYELRKKQVCAVCGGMLNVFMDSGGKAFLACNDWHRTQHEGIAKEAQYYQENIPTGRETMEQQHGVEKTKALERYSYGALATAKDAMHVLDTIWPDAPNTEKLKAALLCVQYQLNPLMRHVFLIPFSKGTPKEKWATVLGIQANRLIAHRAGDYSYIDNTPRVMTKEEQETIFGEVYEDRICAITKLKDSKGNEAAGYGFWLKGENPYGSDKGNTKANMAFIRSERQATDRLFAGKVPEAIEVVDERYMELDNGREVDVVTGEIATAVEEPEPAPQEFEDAVAEPLEPEEDEPPTDPVEPVETEAPIESQWLIESVNKLKWNVLAYIKDTYGIVAEAKENLLDVVNKKLSAEQRQALAKEIQDRLDMLG